MPQRDLLNADSIIESAHIAACANAMVDEGLRARLVRLLEDVSQSGPLDMGQQVAIRRQLVKLLARRIGISRDIAQNPGILDEEIVQPLFVIGFPRTGTTLLHTLLAADPAHRGVSLWQVREPSPPPGQQPVAPGRLKLAERDMWKMLEVCPGLLMLHPYFDVGPQVLIEDDEIYALDLRCTYPTMLYELPSVGYQVADSDHSGAYRFLHMYMQHQQWQRPRKRWVMKGLDHHRHLPTLFTTFPDARCVFPHREPQQFFASGAAIGASVFDPISSGSSNRKALGQLTLRDFADRLAGLAIEPMLDDPRLLHVPFTRIADDPVRALRDCYAQWGFDWTADAEAAMRTWLDDSANRSDRYGKPNYNVADYGVEWNTVSPQFDGYRKRFLQP